MISRRLLDRYYPDDRPDATQVFYAWIREHTSPATTLLNLGAGRATSMPIRTFRGEVARVVGADVDPIVLDNDELDEAHVMRDGVLPFTDATFDLIVSDFVFEHVVEPEGFLREAHRVLRPGGSLFFRTTNKHHYVALLARMTPLWFHRLVANRARGLPVDAIEQYPTLYRMNTRKSVRRLARRAGFARAEIRMIEAHPAYLLFATLPFLAGVAYERLVNRFDRLSFLRANLVGRLVR